MSLENTVICIDNSEYTRNGDFYPNRLRVQQDLTSTITKFKLESDPQNDVAIITMAGKRPELICPLTSDTVKINKKLFAVESNGVIKVITSIKIGHLVLRNRQTKNHKMRIIVLIVSPVHNKIPKDELEKLGHKFKKERVYIDLILFGTEEENQQNSICFVDFMQIFDKQQCHLVKVVQNNGEIVDNIMKCLNLISADNPASSLSPNRDQDLETAIKLSLQDLDSKIQPKSKNENEKFQSKKYSKGKVTKLPSKGIEKVSQMKSSQKKRPFSPKNSKPKRSKIDLKRTVKRTTKQSPDSDFFSTALRHSPKQKQKTKKKSPFVLTADYFKSSPKSIRVNSTRIQQNIKFKKSKHFSRFVTKSLEDEDIDFCITESSKSQFNKEDSIIQPSLDDFGTRNLPEIKSKLQKQCRQFKKQKSFCSPDYPKSPNHIQRVFKVPKKDSTLKDDGKVKTLNYFTKTSNKSNGSKINDQLKTLKSATKAKVNPKSKPEKQYRKFAIKSVPNSFKFSVHKNPKRVRTTTPTQSTQKETELKNSKVDCKNGREMIISQFSKNKSNSKLQNIAPVNQFKHNSANFQKINFESNFKFKMSNNRSKFVSTANNIHARSVRSVNSESYLHRSPRNKSRCQNCQSPTISKTTSYFNERKACSKTAQIKLLKDYPFKSSFVLCSYDSLTSIVFKNPCLYPTILEQTKAIKHVGRRTQCKTTVTKDSSKNYAKQTTSNVKVENVQKSITTKDKSQKATQWIEKLNYNQTDVPNGTICSDKDSANQNDTISIEIERHLIIQSTNSNENNKPKSNNKTK